MMLADVRETDSDVFGKSKKFSLCARTVRETFKEKYKALAINIKFVVSHLLYIYLHSDT